MNAKKLRFVWGTRSAWRNKLKVTKGYNITKNCPKAVGNDVRLLFMAPDLWPWTKPTRIEIRAIIRGKSGTYIQFALVENMHLSEQGGPLKLQSSKFTAYCRDKLGIDAEMLNTFIQENR
jgi:hypothetical protein